MEPSAAGSMHGFPASLTSFVGRAQATAEIAAQLTECRLVTVTGPGGAGKTRLAGEVARRVAMSALGADSEQHPGIAIPAWRNINTDQMMRTTSAAEGPGMDHRVRLGDAWPMALDYLDALLDGFVAGYRCFLQGREELSADSEVKAALSGGGLRVLLRDTANYARLLLYLLQPKFLRDGLDRSIEIEWLARTLTAVNPSPAARLSIYDIERRAMEVQDIPHFTVSVWRAITGACPDQDLRALGNGRGPETLYHRLGTLSETDLQKNMAIIAEAVRQRFAPDVSASED